MLLSSGLWKAELEPCDDGAIAGAGADTDADVVGGVAKLLLLLLLASPYNELG